MGIVALLGMNALVSALCFAGLWLLSLRLKDVSFIDSWWALGMVVIAVSSYFFTGGQEAHRQVLTKLCGVWGLRLGLYLLWRWRQHGPDRRYVTMLGKAQSERSWSFGKAALLLVFALQAPLQFVVALPVQLGQVSGDGTLGLLAWAGMVVAVVGIVFESFGDWQLMRFKADPANAGKVMDQGLWRYTRHPNYFGDACVWWGLWLVAADTGLIGALSIPGPILITVLLTRWSGVPTVEGRMRKHRPGYEDYIARTSSFIPMPPKKVAPSV